MCENYYMCVHVYVHVFTFMCVCLGACACLCLGSCTRVHNACCRIVKLAICDYHRTCPWRDAANTLAKGHLVIYMLTEGRL